MPRYDYFCPANGRTVEVRHGMSESVETWGQLCYLAGLDPDEIAPDSPVQRRLTAALPITGRSGAVPEASRERGEPCGPSCGCF